VRLSTLDAAATSPDSTWSNTEAALWSYLELTIAMMASCLPTLRPFMAKYFPRLMASSISGSGGSHDADLSGPRQPTWGGTGGELGSKKRVRGAPKPTDSTDELYIVNSDAEMGLELTGTNSVGKAVDDHVEGYKAGVARRTGRNETVIGAGTESRSSEQSSLDDAVQEAESRGRNGIRATTVIKQEYQAG
jgi:hypothetical protein